MRAFLLFVPVAALVGCQSELSGPRGIDGKAEASTSALLAIDSTGAAFEAVPNSDLTFHLDLPTTHPVHVFVVKGEEVQIVRFAEKLGGPPVASSIPNHEGSVQMGALSTCDCNGDDVSDEAEAEESPLEQIDSDDDGTNDAEDADDDSDGDSDDSDSDDDGEDGPDSEADLDTDDDGSPDMCDDDDDNDGIGDADSDGDSAEDSDDDGVSDENDADDDNDGDSDDSDGDDDDDGIEDEAEDDNDGEGESDDTP